MKFTKETLKRVIRTFLQAALAYIVANWALVDFSSGKDVAKSALIGLVVSAVAAGLAAIMNLQSPAEPPEQLGGTSTLTFADWIKKYLGKKTDYDGVYGVQCVDLIDCYIDKCLGLKKGFWGNAKDWWIKRNDKWLKNNFDIITPTYKNGELKAGDIGIRTSGKYGHIFIVAEPSKNGDFKYYDQNASGKCEAMTLRTKAFTSANINGVLRPKNQTPFKAAEKPKAANPFKKGSVYTLTTNVNVRTGAGTNYSKKKVSQLTADGRKNAASTKSNAYAVLKSGTRVTVNELKTVGSDIWAKIPSGWICLRYGGKNYAE